MTLNWNKCLLVVPCFAVCVLVAGCAAAPKWPTHLDATTQPAGISRTIRGVRHVLRAPIIQRIPPQYARYMGPVDWQGNPAIGDPYVDSLNFRALATCESGVPGGNPHAYNPSDSDSGGARYGAYQTALETWHYSVDLNDDREWLDPYQDPRDAPLWYQTYRDKRKMLKELIRGPQSAWRYPPETHHRSCGERLFTGRPPGAPPRIP
jgi:hypothetical protein